MSTKSDDHTLVKINDYQEEEVDYEDPESLTHRDPQISVTSTVADIDRTVVHNTDDTGPNIGATPPRNCADTGQP